MTGFLTSRWFSRDATIRFALGVYVCALIFPAIHELSEESGGPCTHCEELLLAGPVLRANCGEDCHDPSHHHHHGHDHSRCAICHATRGAEAPTTTLAAHRTYRGLVARIETVEIVPVSASAISAHPIRGPPILPASV